MAVIKPSTLREVIFERRDSEIFKIPDTKTKLDTLQNYFFPRFDVILKSSLELVEQIYEINPYSRINYTYRPHHRKDANKNKDFQGRVYAGIRWKRSTNQNLISRNLAKKPRSFFMTNLTFQVEPIGNLRVALHNYAALDVANNSIYFSRLRKILDDNLKPLTKIFSINQISCGWIKEQEFVDLSDVFTHKHLRNWESYSFTFQSPTQYFPITFNRGISRLITIFVVLYPLFDAFNSVESGEPVEEVTHQLSEMLKKYKKWYLAGKSERENEEETQAIAIEVGDLPELDSYSFIRSGLWWEVLARDKWTCRSCGRSVKEHGIVLHVDHINPRSLGGTNDKNNLQSLCMKCNIGKSNKDSTDLRVEIEQSLKQT